MMRQREATSLDDKTLFPWTNAMNGTEHSPDQEPNRPVVIYIIEFTTHLTSLFC